MAEPTLWQGGFLAELSPRAQEKLLGLAESMTFTENETIFREGDPSLYFYIVKSGRVSIDVHLSSKGRRTLLTVNPGELFSWSALVEPRRENASAHAVEPTEVLAFRGGTVMDLCLEDSGFGFEIYRALCGLVAGRLVASRLQFLDALETS